MCDEGTAPLSLSSFLPIAIMLGAVVPCFDCLIDRTFDRAVRFAVPAGHQKERPFVVAKVLNPKVDAGAEWAFPKN